MQIFRKIMFSLGITIVILYLYVYFAGGIWKADLCTMKQTVFPPTKEDIISTISISDKKSADKKRAELRESIFKGINPDYTYISKLDNMKLPPEVESFYDKNVPVKTEFYQVKLPKDFTSTYIKLTPENADNCLFIYHYGHTTSTGFGRKELISPILNKNKCSVLFLHMPYRGINSHPDKKKSHNSIGKLASKDFNPMIIFLMPVVSAIDYETRSFKYDSVYMAGLSGGGWTTTLIAAIEPRVKKSFAIAGSYPLPIKQCGGNSRDWEQKYEDLYNLASYADLYILASYGKNRYFFQINNQYDDCCWNGEYQNLYKDEIMEVVDSLGEGKASFILDSTHNKHQVSDFTAKLVLENMQEEM